MSRANIALKSGKFIFLFIILFWFLVSHISAQQTHYYTLTSNQPPILSVNAGADVFSEAGETEILGADPVASGGTAPYSYLWEPAEGLSNQEEANPEIETGSSDAVYTVTVTDAMGCVASDNVTVFSSVTSITKGITGVLSVYPNPVQTLLSINTEKSEGKLTLFNSQGEKVLEEEIMSFIHYINVSSFPKGIYLLKIYTDKGVYTERIIIQ